MGSRTSLFLLGGVSLLVACGGELAQSGDPSPDPSSSATPAPTLAPTSPVPTPALPPAPPVPEPLSCPTKAGSILGGDGIVASIALGAATYHIGPSGRTTTLFQGTWSGSQHSVSGRQSSEVRVGAIEALGKDTWAASEGFTDSFTRTVVAYRGLDRLGSFEVRNGDFDRTYLSEGMSPSYDTIVFQDGGAVSRAVVGLGKDNWERTASPLCVSRCDLLWAKGDDVLMVKHAAGAPSVLIRMSFSSLGTVAAEVTDPTAGRAVAAVTENRIFFDSSYDSLAPIVLDRKTLAVVPFEWQGDDDIEAVRERTDGTFDVFSVFSGEIASAKHVAADGKVLLSGTGHAAYGQTSAGACGFWVGGRFLPYATNER